MTTEQPMGAAIRDRVAVRLEELGLTPITAATRAGLPRDTIRNLFRGEDKVLRVDTLQKIAKALGVTPAQLLGDDMPHVATAFPQGGWSGGDAEELSISSTSDGWARLRVDKRVPMSVALKVAELLEGRLEQA